MVFSCSWPAYANSINQTIPWEHVANICNLWREFDDIQDNWESLLRIVDFQEEQQLFKWARPGAWNDPDMLEVGNGGMTFDEYKAHFSLWAMLAAPLIAGNDLRNMSKDTISILTNPEVIAVDQDPLGRQGRRVLALGNHEVWTRLLHDKTYAVLLWNRGSTLANIKVMWKDIGLGSLQKVRDLWARTDRGVFTDSYSSEVLPHGVAMLKVTPLSTH